jgi:endonuclease/exonuclease/phosphatase family metal-dependent hydrolase
MGDFNIERKSYLYSHFMKDSNIIDIFADDNISTMHEVYVPAGKQSPIIDYMFINTKKHNVTVLKKMVVLEEKYKEKKKEFYLSDHLGLYSELTFNI